MDTMDKRKVLIENISDFPEAVEAAIRPLSEAQINMPCGEGEWTVHEVVHHMADAHINGYVRMKLVLTETLPILKPYDQDAWVELNDTTSLDASLAILRGLHIRWCQMLSSLSEDCWTRQGVHLENGLMSLDDLLRLYAQHGEEHLDQIRRLRKSQGIEV